MPISRWDIPVGRKLSLWQQLSPAQIFVGSFVLLILLGALGLRLLPGLYTGPRLGWLDSLFTSTSAVCVTGLTVVDTATFFTPLGQAWILLLIQLGGLGMIAFTSLIIVALGRRLSLRQEVLYTGSVELAHVTPQRLVADIIRFTLILEALGAIALYILWLPRFGWAGAIWPALFHAISAFCNAGFSTFSDSLIGFRSEPATQLVIMLLIVTGGLGFLTLEEISLRVRARGTRRIFRISLHSRIVISTTIVLLLGGWALFTAFEWNTTLGDLPPAHKALNALFMSVTCRTAGFNTIDYGQATESSNFLTIVLMMIGGSPGSTAGGIKTTTFALLGLLAWSRFRGEASTNFLRRSVREETTERAVGLFVVAFGVVTAGIFILITVERGGQTIDPFLLHMFEAVSAFNTVGLSMGVTGSLSPLGRLTAILLMFLGRVGPLTFAAALALRRRRAPDFRYAYEDVVVG